MIHRDIVEGEPAWHAIRLDNLGGSEIAGIFGVQAGWGQSAFTLHLVKARKIPPPPVPSDPGTLVWAGKHLEATIAKMAAEQEGWTLEKGYYCTDDECPGMACSLDYIITEPGLVETEQGFHGFGVAQIKNVSALQWRDEWNNGEPPFYILLQLQHELCCSGATWGVIAALVGGNEIHVYRYPASVRMATAIRDKVREFWEGVRAGQIPNVDGTDSTALALKALYPSKPTVRPIDFGGVQEFTDGCVQFLTTAANLKASKDHYAAAKAFMETMLKGETKAVGDGHKVDVSVNSANGGRTIRIREDHRR
jgi:predicted phage-related endonuclease